MTSRPDGTARRRVWPALSRLALAACLAATVAACTGSASAPPLSGDDSADGGHAIVGQDAVLTYGYPLAATAAATFQPDVVVIADGPAAIRSVSANGLVWTLDRTAKGVQDLRVGAVMLATSRAIGRVVDLRDAGAARSVTLAPVDLTEVIQDGTIDLGQDLDLSDMVYQVVPDLPGAVSDPSDEAGSDEASTDGAASSGAAAITVPVVRLVAAGPGGDSTQGGQLSPASKGSVSVPVGDWTVTPSGSPGKLGLGISYQGPKDLKVGVDMTFLVDHLRVTSKVVVSKGTVVQSGFMVEGVKGLQVSVTAGAAVGSLDNSKVRIEAPIELNAPIPPSPATGGLPLNVRVRYKAIIETALTGENATLWADGEYKLDGPFGIAGGVITTPEFSVSKSIIDSIGGLTLGPSGIVMAMKMELMAGVGTYTAMAGPYGTMTASLGLTNGSSLGASLARCRGATLDLTVGGGVGVSVSKIAKTALERILPKGSNVEASIEVSKNVVHRAQTVPDVPLCSGTVEGGAA